MLCPSLSIPPLFRSSSRRFGSFEPGFLLFLASNTLFFTINLTSSSFIHSSIHSSIHPFIHSLHSSHLAPPLQNRYRALRDVLELDLRLRLIMQRAATSHSLQTRTSAHLDLLQRHEVSIVQLQGPQRRVVLKQKTLRLLKRSRSQLDILQARAV